MCVSYCLRKSKKKKTEKLKDNKSKVATKDVPRLYWPFPGPSNVHWGMQVLSCK